MPRRRHGLVGVNWNEKSFATSAGTVSHYNNTHLDIDGSGYLVSLWSYYDGEHFCIELDGGTTYEVRVEGADSNTGGLALFPIRFNESLKITSSRLGSNTHHVWVVLD